MSDRELSEEQAWEAERGWEGHKLSQLRSQARLPLHVKIAWLEKAQRLAKYLTSQSAAQLAEK